EVVSILDLRAVGVAKLLVQILLIRKRVIGSDVEREMVTGAGAESPAARAAIRFVQEDERSCRAAVAHFEAVIRTIDAGLAEAERLDEKPFLFFDFAHRQHGAVESARRYVRRDLVGRPAGARVVRILDDLEQQA